MKHLYIVDDTDQKGKYSKLFKENKKIELIDVSPTTLSEKPINTDSVEKIIGIAKPQQLGWKLPSNVLKTIPNLKAICTKSSWKEYIDLNYCEQNNIAIFNNVGINSQSVAEYAIFQMFALARYLPSQIKHQYKEKECISQEHFEIAGKTAGIIGLGNIDSRIAKLCEGLGMNVIYWSRSNKNTNHQFSELNNLLSTSDVIFNCIETSKETSNFLNKSNLELIKPTSFVVSVLGGCGWENVQDDYYLINMVKKGKLAGYSIENNHHPTFKMPEIENENIFFPVNMAYYTKEANERANQRFIENILSVS